MRNSNPPDNLNTNVGVRPGCFSPPAPFTVRAAGRDSSGSTRRVQTRSGDRRQPRARPAPNPRPHDPHSASPLPHGHRTWVTRWAFTLSRRWNLPHPLTFHPSRHQRHRCGASGPPGGAGAMTRNAGSRRGGTEGRAAMTRNAGSRRGGKEGRAGAAAQPLPPICGVL